MATFDHRYQSNHSLKNTVHFIISDGKKRLFYGLDGAWLTYEEAEAIKEKGVDFDIVQNYASERLGDIEFEEKSDKAKYISKKGNK